MWEDGLWVPNCQMNASGSAIVASPAGQGGAMNASIDHEDVSDHFIMGTGLVASGGRSTILTD